MMTYTPEKLAVGMGAVKVSKEFGEACRFWGIGNPNDQARYIAQLKVESAGFTRIEENLNYSGKRLLEVFRGRNGLNDLATANRICAAGPRAVGNFIYGGAWGLKNLGNTQPDDGWWFRGRGYIMLTGRANYKEASLGCYGDQRLMTNPDLLLIPREAMMVSAWFWYSRRLNGVTDIREVTRKINGGLLELDRRRSESNRALSLVASLT